MNSDKAYWEKFYQKKQSVFFPSPFAKFCFKNYITKEDTIIDLGCGNGRDTLYFASKGLNVVGIDQSKSAIAHAVQKGKEKKLNSKFIIDDFVHFDYAAFDFSPKVFYARFTLHAVCESAQNILLQSIRNNVSESDRFFVEIRTTNDSLYGKGKMLSHNEFVTDHYRRFVHSNQLLKEFIGLGFKTIYFIERNNLAVFKDENPIVARYILGIG